MKPTTSYTRRNEKDSNEAWDPPRSAKAFGSDDGQRGFRRNGERDTEMENRNGRKLQGRGFDNYRRDDDANYQMNGAGRGTRDTWNRESDGHESRGLENNKEQTRTRDWRDGERGVRRGVDREWNRGGREEKDPEWMLESEAEERKQVRTAEDIEKWKASMKASKTELQPEPTTDPMPTSHDRSSSGTIQNGGKGKNDAPLVSDPTLDKFFGLWNVPPTPNGVNNNNQGSDDKTKQETARTNAPKPSRFTGFFNPKPETTASPAEEPKSPSGPTASVKDSSSEDKEGFQRILQMLGGGTQTSSNINAQSFMANLMNPNMNEQRVPPDLRQRTPPKERQATFEAVRTSPPIHSPRSRRSIGLENLLGPQSPKEGPAPQNRDSEFLLKLMQHKGSDLNNVLGSGNQRGPTGSAPGILPFPNMMQPHPTQQQGNQMYRNEAYGDPAMMDLRRDKLNPTANGGKRMSGLPSSESFDELSQNHLQQQQRQPLNHQFPHPPGLQRPPGFEQLPLSFNQHMQPTQLRQNMMAAPPGFPQNPNLSRPNPNQFPPGLIPNLSNMNLSNNDRGVPFASMRGMGQPPGPPLPPPGFMPPGFPQGGMGGPHDGRISPERMYFGGGGPLGRGGPPMDVFGELEAGVGGFMPGRGVMPGQYRRQE